MDYLWKIVMKNGKEYVVKDKEKDVVAFMNKCTKPSTYTDFILAKPIEACYGFAINTVMIKGDEVSSVEYSIE